MASAGRILIIPRGDYDANSTYDNLDLVKYKGTSWLAKKTVTGIEPSTENSEYWQDVFDMELANNLTMEEAGHALDAMQGKVLDEKITKVNNDLLVRTESTGVAYKALNATYGVLSSGLIYKVGKEVQINIGYQLTSEIAPNEVIDFMEVYPNYCPHMVLQTVVGVATGSYSLYCEITTDGKFKLQNYNSDAIPSGTTLCLSVRYVTDSWDASIPTE